MEQTRELSGTLSDLLDRVLDKGLVVSADIIITLSNIPLIAVSLKAAIAGMETMLEYGMMTEFEEVKRSGQQGMADGAKADSGRRPGGFCPRRAGRPE